MLFLINDYHDVKKFLLKFRDFKNKYVKMIDFINVLS